MPSDSRGKQRDIPTTKPRKRPKKPNPPWRAEHTAAKTVLRQVRIFMAHAIGGMQRSTILGHVSRNHKAHFEDDALGICAGLWNFVLSYEGTTLVH